MESEVKINAEVDAREKPDPMTAAGLLWLLLDDVERACLSEMERGDSESAAFAARVGSIALMRAFVGTPDVPLVRRCQAILPTLYAKMAELPAAQELSAAVADA